MKAPRYVPWLALPNGWPAFEAAILAGAAANVIAGTLLAEATGVPRGHWRLAIGAAIVSALAYVYGGRLLKRSEATSCFGLLASVLAGTWGTLALAGIPALRCLDALAAGLAVNQVFGRFGCLLAGCCHGRPARRGLAYGARHAESGFPSALVDLPLFPIQLLEATLLACLSGGLVSVALRPHPAGELLALYLTGYAIVRCVLEPFRGDVDRAFLAGLSEAQWCSIATLFGVATFSWRGGLQLRALHLAAAVCLTGVVFIAQIVGAAGGRRLFHPGHILELASATRRSLAAGRGTPIQVETTSLGLCLSAGFAGSTELELPFLTVSRDGPALTPATARRVGRLLAAVARRDVRLVAGGSNVFHLLLGESAR